MNSTLTAYSRKHQSNLRTHSRVIGRAAILMNYGLSIRKIASLMNVSPTTIQRWKRRNFEII